MNVKFGLGFFGLLLMVATASHLVKYKYFDGKLILDKLNIFPYCFMFWIIINSSKIYLSFDFEKCSFSMIIKRKIKSQAKADLWKITIDAEYIKKYLCVWKYF